MCPECEAFVGGYPDHPQGGHAGDEVTRVGCAAERNSEIRGCK